MNRAGLKKVVKTVRGKRGTVRRSYWVRAQEAGKGIIKRHGGKIAAGAMLGAAILAANYFGDRNHGASRRASVGSGVNAAGRAAHKAGGLVAGAAGSAIGSVVGAGRSAATAISNTNIAQNLAHHTTGAMTRARNTEFQTNQAASMAWGGRSLQQVVNFTPTSNHGFSGDTFHVGSNTGSSLSAQHAAQYEGSHHINVRGSGDNYVMGVGPAVRAFGPVSRRAGPIARRLGS